MVIEKKVTIEVHVHPRKASTQDADDQAYRSELIEQVEAVEADLELWAKQRSWPRPIDANDYDKGYYSIKVSVQ